MCIFPFVSVVVSAVVLWDEVRYGDAAIVASASVQKTGKVLHTDKASGNEERILNAVSPAIANVGATMGYETWLPDENGTWVKFNGQSSIKNANHIRAHSTASDERLGNTVEAAVEANWNVVKGLATEREPEPGPMKPKGTESVGNPFAPGTPTVTPTPLRKTHVSGGNLKTDQTESVRPFSGNQAQLSPVSLSTLSRLMTRKALEGLVCFLLLCLLVLCIVGLVALWRRKPRSATASSPFLPPPNKILIKPRAHVPISLLIPKQDAPKTKTDSANNNADPRDPFSNPSSVQH